MIDRQELIALLDKMEVAPFSLRGNLLSFRETLADEILQLDSPPAPDVADTGTIFPDLGPGPVIVEYAGGYHYPHGSSPGHKLIECNRRNCGPRLS